MKKLLFIFTLFMALCSFKITAEPTEIIDALKSGKSTEVSNNFDDFIDLTLPNKPEMTNVGKNQAGIALKAFYDEINVETFNLTSKREAGSIMYITGKLQGKSKNENITLILKSSGSKFIITSLRIGT